jgi:hypothetical protein
VIFLYLPFVIHTMANEMFHGYRHILALPLSHHVDENSDMTPFRHFVPVSRFTLCVTSVTDTLLLALPSKDLIMEIKSDSSMPISVLFPIERFDWLPCH